MAGSEGSGGDGVEKQVNRGTDNRLAHLLLSLPPTPISSLLLQYGLQAECPQGVMMMMVVVVLIAMVLIVMVMMVMDGDGAGGCGEGRRL